MPTTPEGFQTRLARIRADLVQQGRRVQTMLEAAGEALFALDIAKARQVAEQDDEIDRVDVEIEQACVTLLTDACRDGANLAPDDVRAALTAVKVNNELERIADEAVSIAESTGSIATAGQTMPETFRVMANSVVGILRDVCTAYDRSDTRLAKIVLKSQDTAAAFKRAIVRDAERRIHAGDLDVDAAFLLQELATTLERIADHCTNVAEQVIYSSTGAIVRHLEGHWVEVGQQPKAP